MLTFYNNYLDNIAQTPNDDYLDLIQASINSQWEMSTQRYSILQQDGIGLDTYTATDISVDLAIELSTGMKKSDDFKTFSYKNIQDDAVLGIMYQWENNYWICHTTSEYGNPTNSIGVRRCNNIAKWINPYNGQLLTIPCVIDYEFSSPQPKVNKDVEVANGHIVMIVQGNDETSTFVERNQRLFFNGTPYKVTAINNMLQNDYTDSNTSIYYYDLYLDVILPTDEVSENIANKYEYIFTMAISESPVEQVNGFSGMLTAQVKMNNDIVARDVVWSSNDNGNINQNGEYTLTGVAGEVATFTATFGDLTSSVNINIVDAISDSYEIVVQPNITELLQNESNTISVYLYNNGVVTNDIISYSASGVNSANYTIIQNGNDFTITNLLVSTTPLDIEFSSNGYSKTVSIILKALF